jgi:hypothetical protein
VSNAFNSQFDAMAPTLFVGVGLAEKDATFRRKNSAVDLPCTVLIDESTQFQGDLSQVPQPLTTLTAYVADIGATQPASGETFTTNGRVFVVDSILDKDDSRFVCSVVESQ